MTRIDRFVALMLAIVWSFAGLAGIGFAVVNGSSLVALLSLFALCYGALWLRVFVRSRLLKWTDIVLPWRTR